MRKAGLIRSLARCILTVLLGRITTDEAGHVERWRTNLRRLWIPVEFRGEGLKLGMGESSAFEASRFSVIFIHEV